MEVGIVDREKLVDIADAVRKKKGITVAMTLDAIASNITSMPISDNNAKYDFTGSGSKSSIDLMQCLTKIDLSGLDTSKVWDMSFMFKDYSSLTSLDLSGFDTSKVDTMMAMFNNCSSLTSLDVSGFNTSMVADMNEMFAGCISLTSLDVSGFDTSNADNMMAMFGGCSSLKTLDLSNFDFSNTYASPYTGLVELFNECKSLETIKLPATVTFNNSGVSFNEMFKNCNSLTSLDLSGFDTSNVGYMRDMFQSCWKLSNLTLGNDWASNSSLSDFSLSSCPLTHESALDVINKLATRDNSPVIKFNSKVGLYQSEIDIATNKGWSVSGCRVLVDAETATVGQYTLIDGVLSKCVYVADTPQDWGQKIFASQSHITYSNGKEVFQWGGYGTATGITATGIGKGLANTNALLAMNLQSSDGSPTVWDALKEFRSKYGNRWFIASLEESSLYIESVYWTSSEDTSQSAYTRNTSVSAYSVYKTSTNNVYAFTYV